MSLRSATMACDPVEPGADPAPMTAQSSAAATFGPSPAAEEIPSLEEAYEACRRETAEWAKTFYLGTLLMPPAKRRAIWLGINLLTAFLASWTIGLFEITLQQVVALAVLMPIVASMGGIAGSQTLTLMIRGLALEQITEQTYMALLRKEMGVAALNGVLWSVVIAIITYFWFGDWVIGGIIGMAIIINIVAAAISGVMIPIWLEKLDIDPALSGSVILTTVTDVVGFFAFLGLGSLFLIA